ncbi:NUDIX hydrolase [Belnapia rosea]|uniref:NUDIX hydrolase n=1 Tax=Belnapia rosea TaxID=938405 RepID=UPI000884C8A3|nr:NUDIX hydrolase [Belnapia rosea]SDB72299.1 NUDIX domain-containing protein [Belnapia rosea]
MTIRPWRRTGNRTVHRDRWVHLRAEAWETGDGAVLDPWYMLDWADWVNVVALTPDSRLLLVRQFRPGAGAAVLELPGGMVEPGEGDPVAAARREFAEETGHDAPRFELVASLCNDPAHAGNRVHVVLAEGATPSGGQRLDHGEEIALEALPLATVLAGLGEGLIGNANHVGGLLLALRKAGRIGF